MKKVIITFVFFLAMYVGGFILVGEMTSYWVSLGIFMMQWGNNYGRKK